MKPRIIDRILLVLYMLALTALGLGVMAYAFGLIPAYIIDNIKYMVFEFDGGLDRWIIAGIGLLIVLISLRLIFGMNRRAKKDKGPAAAVISAGEFGTASITLAALDEMVRRYCQNNCNVVKCDSVVSVSDNKLMVNLKLNLAEEANIPDTTAALRDGLADYIQSHTGIQTGNISMLVASSPEQSAQAK